MKSKEVGSVEIEDGGGGSEMVMVESCLIGIEMVIRVIGWVGFGFELWFSTFSSLMFGFAVD